jgi:diguanylate cyclase (GGDEF)-like protein/PAS domain S-box-containing protein
LAIPNPNLTDKEDERRTMRGKSASMSSRLHIPCLRRHRSVAPLAVCFFFVTLAIAFSGVSSLAYLIWVTNGILLAYLLLSPRRRWAAYLSAGLVAHIIGSALIHTPWRITLLATTLDLAEVLFAALLLRGRTAQLPRFTDYNYLFRFLAVAVLAAPLATASVFALVAAPWLHAATGTVLLQWASADGLGTIVATPVFVAILSARFNNSISLKTTAIYLILIASASFATLSQARVQLPFLLYPLLILVLLRLGLGWSAMATLIVAGVGSWYTAHGQGPFTLSNFLAPLGATIELQIFLASAMLMLYSISVALERQKTIERELQKIASLHRLVTENSRDLIIVADFDGNRSYVSSASMRMGGWKPEEAADHTAFQLVHPEDLYKAEAALREMQSGREDALIECRVRKADGEYLWVEAALRLIRDPGTGLPSGILNTVRDISERKRSEQQLREAYRTVEALALTDGLTGVANRRRFDQYLAIEWRRSMRNPQPLSLLMLDVDLFKLYNDTYGHQRGDNGLKQIAEACMDVVSRPGDLVARFGGEEFVVVLPNTDSEGALQVANEICESLRSRRLPHTGSPFGIITISIGCATLIPQADRHAPDLIAIADHALYAAKSNGRNQVSLSNALERRGEEPKTSALQQTASGTLV